MRTTLTLEDDVVAVIEAERRRTGESMSEVVNRLLRSAARDQQLRRTTPTCRWSLAGRSLTSAVVTETLPAGGC